MSRRQLRAGILCALAYAGALHAEPHPDWVAVLEAQGEHALALSQWRSGAVDTTSADAAQRLLRLLLQQRQLDAAASLLGRRGADFEPARRALLTAYVASQRRAPEETLAHLQGARVPAALQGFALALRAEALARLERWAEARAAAVAAAATPLPVEIQRRLRLVEGQACLALGDLQRLRQLAPSLGADARSDDRTGLLLLQLARAAMRTAADEQAWTWLLDLLGARATPAESAYVTLQTAATLGAWRPTVADEMTLARYEERSGHPGRARQRLLSLEKRAPLARDEEAELWLAVAGTYRWQGRNQDCLDVLAERESRLRGTRSEADMLLLRGRSRRSLGDEAGTIAAYEEMAQRFPADARADDALYEVAWRHEIGGDFGRAEAIFAALPRRFPGSSLVDDASFRAGLCAFRSARFDKAIARFVALEEEHPRSPLVPRAMYWRAWILERRGKGHEAAALRGRLQADFGDSYFAVLAAAPMRGDTTPSLPLATNGSETGSDAGLALAWRNHTRYTGAIESLRRLGVPAPPAGFEADTELWRFCIDHGLAREARWELVRLEKRYAVSPGALLELLAHAYSRGAHESLVRFSFMLSLLLPRAELAAAIEVLRYPAPLSVSLASACAENGLSHATVLALIRQESAFDAGVDSRAGARGLMQIMPAVGRQLLDRRGRGNLHIDVLYDPAWNIALGCELFAEELDRAEGRLPQALAAYNAGSEPAAKWVGRLAPEEPAELYLDVAEYLETRNYLERVLGGAAIYQRVYALP